MDRAWKRFEDATYTHQGPPPSVQEQADDEIYANDVNNLANIIRRQAGELLRSGAPESFYLAVARIARRVAWPLSHEQFAQYVFETHGPSAVLLALKRAYDAPDVIVSDIVEHP